MVNKHNQTQYYLFFATQNWLGYLQMKQAMWNAAPGGEFTYADLHDRRQANLFDDQFQALYAQSLAESLRRDCEGKTLSKRQIIERHLAWHPVCIKKHLTIALKALEYEDDPSTIEAVVLPDGRLRRKGTYPEDCTIRFARRTVLHAN